MTIAVCPAGLAQGAVEAGASEESLPPFSLWEGVLGSRVRQEAGGRRTSASVGLSSEVER